MSTSSSILLAWSTELTAATDREDWESASRLLAQINLALRQSAAFDKTTLETVLAAIEHATKDTVRRRDEISVLVKALGGSAVTSAPGNASNP